MTRGRWLLGIALTLLALPAAAQQRPEVTDLRFRGNQAFSEDELAPAIATQESACRLLVLCWVGVGVEPAFLDPTALEADAFRLKVYYYERGYREAQITSDTVMLGPDAVRVTFRIQEGRPVRVDSVAINGLPAELAGRRLPLRANDPFDVVAYEATRDTLQARLWNRGYARGQVLLGYTIRRETPYRATVQYDVFPGDVARFGEITVEGTEESSPELVRRMLAFREGHRYSRWALLQSQRNLYGLQIFRHANVQADLEAVPDSVIPVTVQVAEGNMHRVRVGGGINSIECGNLEGQWTSRNFLGNGRRLTFRGRLGNLLVDDCSWLISDEFTSKQYETELTYLASVDFTQPWFFGPRNNIGVGFFIERRNIPQVFVRRAYGGYLSLSRSIGGDAALTLAYRPERTELITQNELVFCVNFVGCAFDEIDKLRDLNWLAPLTLTFTMDRTDAVFTPSQGYILRVDLEHAANYTGSAFGYSRFLAEGSQYFGEQGGVVLATRIRGGIGIPSNDEGGLGLYPQKRFFAGGANSVRGTEQYRLGPTILGIDAVPWLVAGDDPATGGVEGAGCTMSAVNDGSCSARALSSNLFELFPAGGEVLMEGSMELRFPLRLWDGNLRGAVFVDAGQVWAVPDSVGLRDIVVTPGFGLRYHSPIGPIRVDAGFDTQGRQELRVLTTRVQECALGEAGCSKVYDRSPRAILQNGETVVVLDEAVAYRSDLSSIDSLLDFLNRFQLHFSIGQAF